MCLVCCGEGFRVFGVLWGGFSCVWCVVGRVFVCLVCCGEGFRVFGVLWVGFFVCLVCCG